mmetsp:Transcript_34717/g.83007  ORF Transcript_34717/g.83007 Transcript_34717/m.83007 type:complete len:290 (+) Transcript_34717:156-1025(+)
MSSSNLDVSDYSADSTSSQTKRKRILVVGGTGQTGKHVVLQLLQRRHNVRAIVRSKERLYNQLDTVLPDSASNIHIVGRLQTTEASIHAMPQEELEKIVDGCDAVVVCLGHNLNFRGLFLPPRRLVTDSVQKLCSAIDVVNSNALEGKKPPTKMIVMGSDGVADPLGGDDRRKLSERVTLSLLRRLLIPHADNEAAASYMSSVSSVVPTSRMEWLVLRPTDLVNGSATKYDMFDKPTKGLFDGTKGGKTTRATVAQCMIDFVLTDELWESWKGKFPVIHDSMGGDVIVK